MRQPSLKELAGRVTAKLPPTLAVDRRRATIAARDAARLEEWHAPLLLGRLHLCANCARYTFGADPAGTGICDLHGDGVMPFLPFNCREFQVGETPTAPAFLPEVRK